MAEQPMETTVRTMVWRQFGAAIDMLENALVVCPASLWNQSLWSAPPDPPQPPADAAFWTLTFHTLFWASLSDSTPSRTRRSSGSGERRMKRGSEERARRQWATRRAGFALPNTRLRVERPGASASASGRSSVSVIKTHWEADLLSLLATSYLSLRVSWDYRLAELQPQSPISFDLAPHLTFRPLPMTLVMTLSWRFLLILFRTREC